MIAFDTPLPWTEALDALDAKGLLPTSLGSKALREEWGTDLLHRSIFSARTTKASVLQGYREQLAELLDGRTNIATARAKMQDLLDGLGYDAERGGFPGDTEVPPAERGTLRDLASDGRVDLVLNTNMRQVANFAMREAGQSDGALFQFPAYELVRVYVREVPRGKRRAKGGALVEDPGNDWPSRWEKVGGQFFDGRMIARKDDPIWNEIGSSGEFSDGLDAPFPPFAFNSGYGWREVPRAECVALGVIGAGTDIQGTTASMNEGVKAAAQYDPDIMRALRAGLKTEIAAGQIALESSGDASAEYLRRAAGGSR